MEKVKNFMGDFVVLENRPIADTYSLLRLTPVDSMLADADIRPGQFVQVATPDNATYLRRPISVCYVDTAANALWLLVRKAGEGTRALCSVAEGSRLNLLYPLGNGFTLSTDVKAPLLIGGGVGVAPLLALADWFDSNNIPATILLGARSEKDVLLFDEFARRGYVYVSTEDGSMGAKGLVTAHPILKGDYDRIYCCGPLPMMKAVAKIARDNSVDCEVSLENEMACGMGVCLCCVEKTTEGNLCVCKDGPVFNIDKLLW